jgi:ABC-type Fe3+-hydroxamate transport system substrate-binding protein
VRFSHRFARVVALFALVGASLVAACTAATPQAHSTVTDDFGDTIAVGARPTRIASLNPATTEIFFALGAGSRLVGRTTYDHWPAEASTVPDLGPGIRPNVEAVLAARPDLVVLYASNDNRDVARRLRAAGVPTVAYRVDRIADFARVTRALGGLTGDTAAARTVVDTVSATLERVRRATAGLPRPTVFWPLWDNPLLAVGGGSFLDELVAIAGGRNVYDSLPAPSPSITFEDLLQRDPDFVLAGAVKSAKMRDDARWRTLRAVREDKVLVIDTAVTLRPAVRLGEAAVSLARLLHPGVLP